jgi:hypothetical protein
MNRLPIKLIDEIIIHLAKLNIMKAVYFNKLITDRAKQIIYSHVEIIELDPYSYFIPSIIIPFVNQEKIDILSKVLILSDDIIRIFHMYLNWYNITRYQTISDSIIIKFSKYFDDACWNNIQAFQTFSYQCVQHFPNELNTDSKCPSFHRLLVGSIKFYERNLV